MPPLVTDATNNDLTIVSSALLWQFIMPLGRDTKRKSTNVHWKWS
jgi:hypothetical protein